MQLDFEAKIKEMALKYNTQLDTAKIKADADLDKMMMANDTKILEQAQKSANMFSRTSTRTKWKSKTRQGDRRKSADPTKPNRF